MAEVLVGKTTEIKEGDRRIVATPKGEVGVFFVGGKFRAYSNVCAHSGGPACEGILVKRTVDFIADDRTYQGQGHGGEMHFACPWHGWEYELETGECVGDRRIKLKRFEVVQRGDSVYVVV